MPKAMSLSARMAPMSGPSSAMLMPSMTSASLTNGRARRASTRARSSCRSLNPLALPDLGDTFMVRRYQAFSGDPTPEVSLAMTRTGGDAAGMKQVFVSREPLAGDVAPIILADG